MEMLAALKVRKNISPLLLGPIHQERPHLDEVGGINVGILPAKAALPQPEGL